MRTTVLLQSSPSHFLTTSLVVVFCIAVIFVTKICSEDTSFSDCKRSLYNCGSIKDVGYPFWGGSRPQYCGRYNFNLTCVNNQYSILNIRNQQFRLLSISQSNFTLRVASQGMWDGVCLANNQYHNILLDLYSPFAFTDADHFISIIYDCASDMIRTEALIGFNCTGTSGSREYRTSGFFAEVGVEITPKCEKRIDFPILQSSYQELWGGNLTLKDAINQGFEIHYKQDESSCSTCHASGGICGSETDHITWKPGMLFPDRFVCFCRHSSSDPLACSGSNRKIPLAVIIAGATVLGVGSLVVCLIMCWRRRTKNVPSLEDLIEQQGYMSLNRYSYSQIKKMTNSFKDKLGQGGYGSVYKGKLREDGHPVAVKILNVSKGNGEDFINEVASISRTSHVNVVTLKGYCLQGSKRALVFDFMPHGSLEKFISKETCPKGFSPRLDWEKLFRITVGVARGLEYLHSGCNTRILHFDIKPHNILLDEDFCPKISDFGLAKLCTGKESIVSMVGARGTVGYIAPEVFFRNFGGVSYKSDVYSYGMMVLEMVGARKKMNNEVDNTTSTSECYFPQWIYKRLEAGEDLELQADMTEEENEITKKMTMVGLWCIQTDPSLRPTMGRVLEMLEGSIERLEFPPQPFLSSQSKLLEDYSTTVTSISSIIAKLFLLGFVFLLGFTVLS